MAWIISQLEKEVNFSSAMDELLEKSFCCCKYEKTGTGKLHKIGSPFVNSIGRILDSFRLFFVNSFILKAFYTPFAAKLIAKLFLI